MFTALTVVMRRFRMATMSITWSMGVSIIRMAITATTTGPWTS